MICYLYVTNEEIVDKLIALAEKEFCVDLYKQSIRTKSYCEIWCAQPLSTIERKAISLFINLHLSNVGIVEGV